VNIYMKIKFSDLLQKSLLFIGRDPLVWIGYLLFVAVILCIGRISYALGIFFGVVCLFVGVGVAKYVDLKDSGSGSVGLVWALKKSLPLAIIGGIIIVICWFIFSAIANIIDGHAEMISYFFFDWQYTDKNLSRLDMRELAIFLYGYSNITIIFTVLMFTGFASWFSYPLMLFKGYSWSQAKEIGNREWANNREALYKTLAFIIFNAFMCMEVIPFFTPLLFMLSSILMFVTYKSVFERT